MARPGRRLGAFGALAAAAAVGAGCTAGREPAPAEAGAPACADAAFSIYFDKGEAVLTAPARDLVADTARRLAGCRIHTVRVVGLADAEGPAAENLELSAARAAYVVEAFAAYGWPKPEFDIAAAGEAGATAPGGADRPLRRRVEVFVDAAPGG